MVSLARKLIASRNPIPISKSYELGNSEALQPFVPFSRLQETKLLESHLVSLLDNCSSLNQIKQVHAHVIRRGLDQCCYVLAKLLRMLTKINVPMDPYPRLVFHQVEYRNPFLWTALIRGYSIQGPLKEAVCLYNAMRGESISPVSFTLTALLKGSSDGLELNLGKQIHCQNIKLGGFCKDLFVHNILIDMYVKCGWLDCGRKVFDEMSERDVISWTSLIVAYSKSGDMAAAAELFERLPVKDLVAWTAMVSGFAQNAKPREALAFFHRMQSEGIETDELTLVGVISACAQLGAAKYANWVCDMAEGYGFGPANHVMVGSALIDMYSKCGNVEEAYKVFVKMKEKNVFSYSSMIMGFAMHGCANAALDLFEEMVKTDVEPNKVTFIGVLMACTHAGLVERGRHLFDIMEKHYGVEPSVEHYACMIDLLGRAGQLEEALELIKAMPMEPNSGVWGALLGACRIHGNPDIAEVAANRLFELEPDSIGNYVLLANTYASAGRWEDVLGVRKSIKQKLLRKDPSRSWIEGTEGVIHEFYAGDMTHPNSKEIKEALEDLIGRLKSHGYEPNLSSVPYDLNEEHKRRILLTHSEKLALAYGLLITDSAGSTIRIMKNLRICEDCHSFMCGASQITGREIIVRDNKRFHHFHNGVCSCGNFW
ncbi:pentatricopeptide repeat-containing protein At5g44230 [Solanum verrucosum]|uniref:pentatricopeptide repeat-containing protein At5g44230 n=1 Tax=Solanum verrucosum TaxID=315347 RepID=UPI0020D16F8C|nr:pentatricopeptide repeat-containing protein At5g44230 [Solanum verrucosum]